jgi:DNA-binding NarL/FixJ family response regulator
MSAPIRVALIEDNDAFREALELLLGLDQDVEVVASAPDGSDAVELCERAYPDVLVLDYRLPGPDGVQVTRTVREACPGVAVVCLTAGVNRHEQEALFRAGAVECVIKDGSLEAIMAAIKRAAGGSS